jgi:hypothetical protein
VDLELEGSVLIITSFVGFAISAVILALLGMRDPKRLRNLRNGEVPLSPRARNGLGWLVLAPGVALAFLGQWWAFFIWLGATCAAGWATAQALAIRR